MLIFSFLACLEMAEKFGGVGQVTTTGCPKKNVLKIVSIISPATKMLEGWDISHLKGGIDSSVQSTKTFLYIIREPRYKQNNNWYLISRI